MSSSPIAVGAEVVAEHRRAFVRDAKALDALHVRPFAGAEARAVAEATALLDWRLAPVWQRARAELGSGMLRLMETHPGRGR